MKTLLLRVKEERGGWRTGARTGTPVTRAHCGTWQGLAGRAPRRASGQAARREKLAGGVLRAQGQRGHQVTAAPRHGHRAPKLGAHNHA